MIKTFFVTIILSFQLQAGLLYTYNQLTLKDLDQMNQLVKNKVKESKAAYSGKTVPIKEALQAVFSRPNSDDMIDKIITPLRSALDQEDATEKVFSELVQEAINALTNTKNFKKEAQVTYAIFLENIISEFKPAMKLGNFEFKTVKKISESKIELTKEAQKDRKLRLMQESGSPSSIAQKVITAFEEKMKTPAVVVDDPNSTADPMNKEEPPPEETQSPEPTP